MSATASSGNCYSHGMGNGTGPSLYSNWLIKLKETTAFM